MCGRFTLRRDLHAVARELGIEAAGGSVLYEPRYSLALWLNPKTTLRDLPGLLRPARDDLLARRAVSMAVNDAKNDGPELLA